MIFLYVTDFMEITTMPYCLFILLKFSSLSLFYIRINILSWNGADFGIYSLCQLDEKKNNKKKFGSQLDVE